MVTKLVTKDALSLTKIEVLARTFPSLARQLGDHPTIGTIDRLRDVALRRANEGSGAVHAAEFILSLWDFRAFDLGRAWGAWDSQRRAAWKAWASDPWWP